MSEIGKRYIVILFLLISTFAFTLFYQNGDSTTAARVDIFKIPLEIGEWKAREIEVEEESQENE